MTLSSFNKNLICRQAPVFIVLFVFFIFTHQANAECRFWAAVSNDIPKTVPTDHLLKMPNSLKSLGKNYEDGWAVGFFSRNLPIVFRGDDSSTEDVNYDKAVFAAAQGDSKIIVAHLRKASSGCVEGVPNPHPFVRDKMGQQWLLGHNGTIKKSVLIELIGEEYLNNNLPNVCNFDPPNSWIDSELYLIYLLKKIEENQSNVEKGIRQALSELSIAIGDGRKALNFFLTDGKSLWAFRKGPTLFYYQQSNPTFAAISSEPPNDAGEGNAWIPMEDNQLAILKPGVRLLLVSIPLGE